MKLLAENFTPEQQAKVLEARRLINAGRDLLMEVSQEKLETRLWGERGNVTTLIEDTNDAAVVEFI